MCGYTWGAIGTDLLGGAPGIQCSVGGAFQGARAGWWNRAASAVLSVRVQWMFPATPRASFVQQRLETRDAAAQPKHRTQFNWAHLRPQHNGLQSRLFFSPSQNKRPVSKSPNNATQAPRPIKHISSQPSLPAFAVASSSPSFIGPSRISACPRQTLALESK